MIQPGTALWFARHEARLAWRDWIAMMTAGRRERRWKVAIGFAVFVILMHAVAYSVVGRFAGATADKPMLVAITASLLLSWLLMASQAMESMTRALKEALGSGSLLQDNVILTNFHVIDHKKEVTVVFKPSDPSGKPAQDEVTEGEVIKVDVQRDLALVRPRSLPSRTVRPLQISSTDLEVGADVAAIGHPEGQRWTFTKEIVSQIRPDYQWSTGPGDTHRATVIRTQTPINPGNSGGPLLSFDGKIVGVNSFRATDSEGLNFAVAAKDIDLFLGNQANGLEALICNDPKIIFEGRNKDETASIRRVSLQCDSTTDIIFVAPDDKQKAYYALINSKRRGKPEGVVFDLKRSGSKWDTSIWDPQGDETFPLKGVHPDGKLMPSSFVPRCGNRKPVKDLKCA